MNAVHVRDQKHELTPPRNRDKPITQQDALPRSEVPAEIFAWAGPVVSNKTSPLSSYFGRLSKHSYRGS
ncbi:hypothetical protein V6N12_048487 [Hibiscus sabdariffa]|uniref:Uncharacterized protein n=1 Tax=Hibiscus sabdariffa TaxID=183260 RepID=A0ABR2EHE3_9ROSI